MGEPYLGEIRMFGGSFAPVGWMRCEGQLLNISEYESLFTLVGTTYGGDGRSTFALPDLRGRVPAHTGQNWVLGQKVGAEAATLSANQIPPHTHLLSAANQAGGAMTPANNVPAATASAVYTGAANPVLGSANAIGSAGGWQPHENMQPYLCINFIIAVAGIYPSQ